MDDGEVLPAGAKDNIHATKYQQRTGDIRNLEASNQLFIKLVEEMHKRGMRVILDGVFNHCGSFNKWMDRERIYEPQPDYPKGAYVSKESPYNSFSCSMMREMSSGLTTEHMMAGGDMIHCQSSIMRIHHSLSSTLWISEENGYHRRIT